MAITAQSNHRIEETALRFSASAEVVREVDAAAETVRRAVLSYSTAELAMSPLKDLDAESWRKR